MLLSALVALAFVAHAQGQCSLGWTFYNDSSGSPSGQEGVNSCIKAVSAANSAWSTASTACPSGSHLLTLASVQNITKNSLYQAAFTVSQGNALIESIAVPRTAVAVLHAPASEGYCTEVLPPVGRELFS